MFNLHECFSRHKGYSFNLESFTQLQKKVTSFTYFIICNR